MVQKTSRKNVTSALLVFSSFLSFDGRHEQKNHNHLKRTALKQKKKKHMHTLKDLEARQVEEGRLSCDSDTPQFGSTRSESTRVVKVNRPKTNHRKTGPYCTFLWTANLAPGYYQYTSAKPIFMPIFHLLLFVYFAICCRPILSISLSLFFSYVREWRVTVDCRVCKLFLFCQQITKLLSNKNGRETRLIE